MENCSRIIKETSFLGVKHKRQCTKPIYKNGLCKSHYDKAKAKLVKWGDRHGYRDATEDDLKHGKHLKIKDQTIHTLYRCRKGVIERYHSKTDKWIYTAISLDAEPFCVKCLS